MTVEFKQSSRILWNCRVHFRCAASPLLQGRVPNEETSERTDFPFDADRGITERNGTLLTRWTRLQGA
jgi:hypothetical protein